TKYPLGAIYGGAITTWYQQHLSKPLPIIIPSCATGVGNYCGKPDLRFPRHVQQKHLSLVYSPFANKSRTLTSNMTLMKQWAETVHSFNTTTRVPVITYLRPVQHLKPLGSAVTSVFVSTFAMVSVLWTIFSIGAGIVAGRSENAKEDDQSLTEDLGQTVRGNSSAITQIELSLVRMRLALKKHGLLEEYDEERSIAFVDRGRQEE
ncbi:hypothetical protein C8R46DRAFT_1276200, partial [Mycena filopes]